MIRDSQNPVTSVGFSVLGRKHVSRSTCSVCSFVFLYYTLCGPLRVLCLIRLLPPPLTTHPAVPPETTRTSQRHFTATHFWTCSSPDSVCLLPSTCKGRLCTHTPASTVRARPFRLPDAPQLVPHLFCLLHPHGYPDRCPVPLLNLKSILWRAPQMHDRSRNSRLV